MYTDTFNIVLDLINLSMNPASHKTIYINDWDELFKELNIQAIPALPVEVMSKIIPENEKQRLIRILSMNVMTIHRQLHAQDSLVHLYKEKNIPFVILKGLAIARYYPHPEYRSLGDIDIAVMHSDYDNARQALLSDGYREINNPYEKHGVFEKNGVVFELHKYFASTNDTEKATYIEEIIQNGIRSSVKCELKGYCFPVLPPRADGIMLLEHMSQHLEEGIGLRHMIDWMIYVSNELDDKVWQNEFQQMADEAGLRKLAEIATKTCVKYLGLRGVSWCECADDTACEKMMEHIENRGNFGKKEADSKEKAQKLFSIYKSPFYLLRYMQRTGLRTPLVRKHRTLKPFAWLIRACNLMRQYFKDGNTFRDLRQEIKEAKDTEEFMDNLGIRRKSRGHTFWNGKTFVIKK